MVGAESCRLTLGLCSQLLSQCSSLSLSFLTGKIGATVPAERAVRLCTVPDRGAGSRAGSSHGASISVIEKERVGKGRTGRSERQDEFHVGQ